MKYVVGKYGMSSDNFVHTYRNNVKSVLHIHSRMEIVLVTEGLLRMQLGKDTCDIPSGCAVLAGCYEPHAFFENEGEVDNRCVILEFPPKMFPPIHEWIYENEPEDRVFPITPEVIRLVTSLLEDTPHGRYTPPSYVRICAVLSAISDSIITNGKWRKSEKKYDDGFIKALNYVTENYDKPIDRTTVARAIGIRPETLSRLFVRCAGVPFLDYVQHLRVYEAARALESGASVTESALNSGFDSIRSFNRVFKKIMHATPTEYLQSL